MDKGSRDRTRLVFPAFSAGRRPKDFVVDQRGVYMFLIQNGFSGNLSMFVSMIYIVDRSDLLMIRMASIGLIALILTGITKEP